ncbi:MAG: hypothetical protein J2P31_02150 [Blastocatellia bacterium]|nr:hypothetical protein [Blastocatellia bacterium]
MTSRKGAKTQREKEEKEIEHTKSPFPYFLLLFAALRNLTQRRKDAKRKRRERNQAYYISLSLFSSFSSSLCVLAALRETLFLLLFAALRLCVRKFSKKKPARDRSRAGG